MVARIIAQPYPRINDEDSPDYGLLDVSALAPHTKQFTAVEIEQMVLNAIQKANQKSSRATFRIPEGASEADIIRIYKKEGRELFKYFKRYCSDPASTAHQIHNKHYRDVAVEQFRNRAVQLQKEHDRWWRQSLLRNVPSLRDYSCEALASVLLNALQESEEASVLVSQIDVPEALIEVFGRLCYQSHLVNEDGYFHDPYQVVRFLC